MKNLIIITGTSQGLGCEFENILSSKNNYIVSINRKNLHHDNQNIYNLCIDLSNITKNDILAFNKLIDSFEEQIEKFIFINNAFTIDSLSNISEIDNNELFNSFNINVISPIILLKEFIKKNIGSKKIILNISSGAAKKPIKEWSIYCTTKASVEMFLQCINKEYPHINVYSIDPGVLDTNMQKNIRENFLDSNYFRELKENNSLLNPNLAALKILKETNIWN